MEHHDDRGAAPGVELGEEVEHLDLVGDVEVGRGLVEQQQVGALREGHRDPHPLALAAGELVDDAVGEPEGVGEGERLGDRLVVGAGPAAEGSVVRVAAAADQVGDGHALGRDGVLRQQPQRAGDLLGRQPVDRLAVEQHRARARPEQAGEPAQQRGLAARVGADDDGDAAVRDLQVQVAHDGGVGVAEREAAGLQPGGLGGAWRRSCRPPSTVSFEGAAGEQPEQERGTEGAGDDAHGQVEVGEGVGAGVVARQHDHRPDESGRRQRRTAVVEGAGDRSGQEGDERDGAGRGDARRRPAARRGA